MKGGDGGIFLPEATKMRTVSLRWWVPALALFALSATPNAAIGVEIFNDGFETGDSCAWSVGPSSCLGPGFQIDTPEVIVGPGEEITYCYYFHTPNVETIGIRRWALTLGSVAHDVTLFATYDPAHLPADRQPAGTMSAANCGFVDTAGSNTLANWAYAAHNPFEQIVLPADDGAGSPLAVEVFADQPMFLQVHFINPTGVSIANTVRLDAEALEIGVAYTKTASYFTYNNSISIPQNSVGYTETKSCAAPAGVEFWFLTTHTHKHATSAVVRDGVAPLVQSANWENPGILLFSSPGFYTFSSSGLTYECVYINPTGSPIVSGNSPISEENCVGIGYFFPATRPLLCIDNTGPL